MSHILDFCFQGLSIQPVTERLVEHLILDMPLTPEEIVDFGVDTQNHYRVLQTIVRDACGDDAFLDDERECGFILLEMHRIIVELDRALGNSAKLNELVHTYVPEYAGIVRFHTTRDVLLEGSETVAEPKNPNETSSRL